MTNDKCPMPNEKCLGARSVGPLSQAVSPAGRRRRAPLINALAGAVLLSWLCGSALAGPTPGPWEPIFKGVDLARGTNTPGIAGNFPRLQVVRCVRVDLTDPDMRFFATPAASNPLLESRETTTQTTMHFLQQNHLQVASDANYFNPEVPSAEGISADVEGLLISDGTVVSPQSSADTSRALAVGDHARYCAILFTTNNQCSFIFANRPPGTNTTGIYTAVTGYYPIVSNGVNLGTAVINAYPDSWNHQPQPRTAFGLSQDARYFYMMTIDGRQPGYSDDALDTETAYWIMQFGAWNAVNMDGGGSTALYMADSTGRPIPLNHSSDMAQYGHDRYVGCNFGLYAKPLPGFFNGINAQPDDTTATITWTTTAPATSQVKYGLTTSLDLQTDLLPEMVTNHAVLLTGLTPNTEYYFSAVSGDAATTHESDPFYFTTTNYATTNAIFALTNTWTYTDDDLDGVDWTARGYDDSNWIGSGPGLLWVDTRGFANPAIPVPMNTEMPYNPATGYPYITYYFRTHFNFTNSLRGASLVITDYIDDAAVFYLNGVEVYRLRMPAPPTPIYNSTLAPAYACGGDATCPDYVFITGDAMTNLVAGDNVLAAEVHNYNAASPDITFGLALGYTEPYDVSPRLSMTSSNGIATLNWSRGGFTLESASQLTGPWTPISGPSGPVVSSPFTVTNTGPAQYFRLQK